MSAVRESLINLLVAPHVSEKSARATEQGNHYVFRVRKKNLRDLGLHVSGHAPPDRKSTRLNSSHT